MRVLVVDDDPGFLEFTKVALAEAGMEYRTAENGERALEVLRTSPTGEFDLILLDVQMPKASGWDLLTSIRESGSEVPVVFVTGRDSVQERVKGLRMGADDYVIKPVEYEELIARLEAVIRRRHALPSLDFGDLRLDLARRRVERAGTAIELSPREYDLLLALVEAQGEILSRDRLLREVWDMDFDPGTNVIDVHVGRLRRKIDRAGRPMIQTVRGKGYRLVAHRDGE